jgi:4-hydroxymandelate oxidase
MTIDLDRFAELPDFEAHASATVPGPVYEHLAAGAGRNWTRDENLRAYDRWLIRKRLMVDVADADLSTTVTGRRLELPIVLAPSAFHKLVHPDGELASAAAARDAGTGIVLSTLSSTSLEDVAAVGAPTWLQLQIHKDRGLTTSLQERAEAAGLAGLCLTVDAPSYGVRPADKRNHIRLPDEVTIANLTDRFDLPAHAKGEDLMAYMWKEMAQDVTWTDAAWLIERTDLPVIVKGVMTPAEARNAVSAGCAAIVVSNQGGRQVDGEPATIDVLAGIVDAVGDEVEVLLDGGVRHGSQVLKALALGARCVLIGRPTYWGLAAGGQEGVAKTLALLREQLENTMQLSGVKSLSEIPAGLVTAGPGGPDAG